MDVRGVLEVHRAHNDGQSLRVMIPPGVDMLAIPATQAHYGRREGVNQSAAGAVVASMRSCR